MSRLLDYLRLMRVSLLPTAWSNVLMGFVLATGVPVSRLEWMYLAGLLICSSFLYVAGMVLNDYFDYENDQVERPERVLPSGKISRRTAGWLGLGLLVVPILLSRYLAVELAVRPFGFNTESPTFSVVICLAALIIFYDAVAKDWIIGPAIMGLCRAGNVLLGCSIAPLNPACWFVALGIGLYVAGITWFARSEHTLSPRRELLIGVTAMLAGVLVLAVFPKTEWFWNYVTGRFVNVNFDRLAVLYWGLLAIMLFPVARRVTVALATRQSADVKKAVVTSLLTLVMIDASLCYLVSPDTPAYALSVALLIAPAWLMSRHIMAT